MLKTGKTKGGDQENGSRKREAVEINHTLAYLVERIILKNFKRSELIGENFDNFI